MVTKWSSSSCDDFENIIFTGTIIQNLYILASYRYLTNNQTKNLGKIELLCSWEVGNLAESRNIIRMWKSLFWQTYRMLIQQWTLARIKIISEFNWFKCWYVQIWHCSSLHGPHICRDRWVHFSWCLVLQCIVAGNALTILHFYICFHKMMRCNGQVCTTTGCITFAMLEPSLPSVAAFSC